MNWLWINIPLMAVFFVVFTGIPLWLVFKRPDQGPVLAQQGQALPDTVAARHAAARAQTAPKATIVLGAAGSDDEFAPPELVQASR
jgi:hypothetical protein